MKFQLALTSAVLMHAATYANADAVKCATDCATNNVGDIAAAAKCAAGCSGMTAGMGDAAGCGADCATDNAGNAAATSTCLAKCTGGGDGGNTGNTGNSGGDGGVGGGGGGRLLGPCCGHEVAISHDVQSNSREQLRRCECGPELITEVGQRCSASKRGGGAGGMMENYWQSRLGINCEEKHDAAGPHSPEPRTCNCFGYAGGDPLTDVCEPGQSCSANSSGPLCSWPSATAEDVAAAEEMTFGQHNFDSVWRRSLPECVTAAPWEGDAHKCDCKVGFHPSTLLSRCGQGSTCEEEKVDPNAMPVPTPFGPNIGNAMGPSRECQCTPSDTQICEYSHKSQTEDNWTCPATCDYNSKVLVDSHRVDACVKYGRVGTGLKSTKYTYVEEELRINGNLQTKRVNNEWIATLTFVIRHETWASDDCSGTPAISTVIHPGCQEDSARSFLVGEDWVRLEQQPTKSDNGATSSCSAMMVSTTAAFFGLGAFFF